jgi:hypothetical protein
MKSVGAGARGDVMRAILPFHLVAFTAGAAAYMLEGAIANEKKASVV